MRKVRGRGKGKKEGGRSKGGERKREWEEEGRGG